MKQDSYGQVILDEDDLFDLVMKGRSYLSFEGMLVDDSVDAALFNCIPYRNEHPTLEQFDIYNQSQWLMPREYYDLDIVDYLISRCRDEREVERCANELMVFSDRSLLNLLRYMVYLVDVMRENKIIWGVGRGSSVSSFVLYLIGVHRINPIECDLLFEDFMR